MGCVEPLIVTLPLPLPLTLPLPLPLTHPPVGCDVPKEVEGIRSLTNDPNPVRVSENDRKHLGTRAPLRVAGSLAVARALGDSYLKIAELSTPLFAPHVPYITGRPTVSYRPLQSTDRQVIVLVH